MRLLIRNSCLIKSFTYIFKVFGKGDKFVIHCSCALGYFQRIFVLVFITPNILDSSQRRHQGSGADQCNILIESLGKKTLIVLYSQGKSRFHGKKHDDEVQRTNSLEILVIFFGKVPNMISY